MLQHILMFYMLIIFWKNSVQDVCTLNNGQNAVYWWIYENKDSGTELGILPLEGQTTNEENSTKNVDLKQISGFGFTKLISENKKLEMARRLDREAGDLKLEAVIECSSLVPGENFKVNISVYVNVKDANDNSPVFSKTLYRVSLAEEMSIGSYIFSDWKATDLDSIGPNSEISYHILANQDNYVSIPNPWNGELQVSRRINYEEIKVITLQIIAEDSGSPKLNSTADLIISILDVDDQNPKFKWEKYSAVINSADKPNGSLALNVQPENIKAVDLDTLAASIIYSLSGTDSENFQINPQTGDLYLMRSISKNAVYLLTVHAHQVDRPERQSVAVLLIKSEKNENFKNPKFSSQSHVIHVPESRPIGSQLLQFSASDFVEDDSNLTFTMDAKATNLPFKVEPISGILELSQLLDFEKIRRYNFLVWASNGYKATRANVDILVDDVNEFAPEFEKEKYYFESNLYPTGSIIGTVKATDDDISDSIKYTVQRTDRFFQVNEKGQIFIINRTNLENNGKSYEIVIIATDSGHPPKFSRCTVNIKFIKAASIWSNFSFFFNMHVYPLWFLIIASMSAALTLGGLLFCIVYMGLKKMKAWSSCSSSNSTLPANSNFPEFSAVYAPYFSSVENTQKNGSMKPINTSPYSYQFSYHDENISSDQMYKSITGSTDPLVSSCEFDPGRLTFTSATADLAVADFEAYSDCENRSLRSTMRDVGKFSLSLKEMRQELEEESLKNNTVTVL